MLFYSFFRAFVKAKYTGKGDMMKKQGLLKNVIKDTAPVIAGYVILGIGFGILMNANGFSMWTAVAMSVFVYAGSMQYAAVGLFTAGASLITVALTTLAVNARHLFYGISMTGKYKDAGFRKPYLIFALTDETYSLVCSTDRDNDYCFLVSLLDHIYWVGGTAIGAVLGNVLPFNTEGVDFALTALFVTVFLDQWMKTKDHHSAIIGLVCSVAALLVFGKGSFLIPAMAAIAVVLMLPKKEARHHE